MPTKASGAAKRMTRLGRSPWNSQAASPTKITWVLASTVASPVFTTATSASLLVFFVLAMQCLPTLVVTRRETGGWRWPLVQLGYMSALAYLAALVTYQGLRALGVG